MVFGVYNPLLRPFLKISADDSLLLVVWIVWSFWNKVSGITFCYRFFKKLQKTLEIVILVREGKSHWFVHVC